MEIPILQFYQVFFCRKNRQKSVDDRLSHSVWYQGGNARNTWKRPCFKGYDFVVLGDSQLKIYGKLNIKKPGYSINSYSGGDVSQF